MLMEKLKELFAKRDNKDELEIYLERTKKNDDLKAQAYKNRSTYVSYTTLRLS